MRSGNPDIANAIFKKSRHITESKGADAPMNRPSRPLMDSGGGAYNSIQRKKLNERTTEPKQTTYTKPKILSNIINESINLDGYFDSLNESMALLKETKEYSSVVRGLLTYYLAGKLNNTLFEGLDFEDKMEIFGIVKDFEATVKSALK